MDSLFVAVGRDERRPFMLPNKLVKTVNAAVVTTLKPQHVIFLVRTDKILIIQSGT